MLCLFCAEEMAPLKDLVCSSGIDTCYAPCWCCDSCGNVSYLHNEEEFELWISEYIGEEQIDPSEKLGLFNSLDKETLQIINDD